VQSDPQPTRAPASRRLVGPFVAVLLCGLAALSLTAEIAPIGTEPALFAALIAAVIFLDVVRLDVFERAKFTPTVPALALAFIFGPAGPIAAELLASLVRMWRAPAVRWLFDLGSLSLSGIAAALVFDALPRDTPGLVIAAATVAGLAFYVVNIALLSAVLSLNEGAAPAHVFRERFAWMWWHYAVHGTMAGLLVVADARLGALSLLLVALPLGALFLTERQYLDRSRQSVRELRALLDANTDLLDRTRRSYLGTIASLARTIEAKDPYTGGHTERVAELACLLARELGFEGDDLHAIEVGGVIHDIGKIGIPDAILLKPGKLDEDEFAEMKRHPLISSHILEDLDLPRIVLDMARHHHERFDGRGYPDGLASEDIPLAARVLCVADALDAMTSDRPYRNALSLDTALAEIDRHAGSQFCPAVVAALRALVARDPSLGGLAGGAAPSRETFPAHVLLGPAPAPRAGNR
jgi:HD domain-containing protein